MDVPFVNNMELHSRDYAHNMELHSRDYAHNSYYNSNTYSFGRFLRPFNLKLACKSSKRLKVSNSSNPNIVSEVFENETPQSGRTLNEHVLGVGRGIEKDYNSNSKTESNGSINHVNGGPHFTKQSMLSTTDFVGDEFGNKKGMVERLMTQGDPGLKVSSIANNVENPSLLVDTAQYDKKAKFHVSWEAATQTIKDANANGYLRYLQELSQTDHQPSTPTIAIEGLGIIEFLKGKTILITGATGFLAKVLVEKILRVQPEVEKIYLLIKAKDVDHAKQRLHDEIIHCGLFKNLQHLHGFSYKDFMERKLFPVVGNLAKDNLGMDLETISKLQREVEIIVNSAASTTFDERYDHALNLNTKGAQRIMEFGQQCPLLQLLMHVSTAFVNGKRQGKVLERAFQLGCSIANESSTMEGDMVPDIDVDMELELIQKKTNDILARWENNASSITTSLDSPPKMEKELQEAMRDLGMERAKKYGWQDTYVFTKALGEMLVDSTRGQLPVVIIRPSVVESAFKDPFPGWMEGNRMMDPILISYGKGQLPGFLVDPQSVLDVVPVDMVASAMLATMTMHANKTGLEVYQIASSVVNPLIFMELARMSREHFIEHPFVDKYGKPLATYELQLFQDMESFMDAVTTCSHSIKESTSTSTNAEYLLKRHKQLIQKVRQQAAYLASLYQPYTFYGGRFDTSKTQQLFASLSSQEKEIFGFDVSNIDWDTYIKTIHIPGLRRHVLKGRGSRLL